MSVFPFGRSRDAPEVAKQEPQQVTKPTFEDFQKDRVQRAVFKNTLTRPETVFPFIAGCLSVVWSVMIAPTPASVAAAFVCTFISAGTFLYNYVLKGPEHAERHVQKLLQSRRESELIDLNFLEAQCRQVGFLDGAREAHELASAYSHLEEYLRQRRAPAVERFQVMAEDGLREGVRMLRQALDVYEASRSIDVAALEHELRHLRTLKVGAKSSTASGDNALDDQIETLGRRIAQVNQSQGALAQLYGKVNNLQAALESTYLQLVERGSQDVGSLLGESGSAAQQLTSAVDALRRVDEKLKGDPTRDAKRNKYIEAAHQAETRLRQQEGVSTTEGDRTTARQIKS